jgi:monothiol glutaredoxin
MDEQVRGQIERAIHSHEVILFMKGTRQMPSCGFSARTVEVLDTLLPDYATVDVLAHPEIREGLKEYSSWPTIPQLYVKGRFVGGADIVNEMFAAGELREALGLVPTPTKAPGVTITERAADAFRGFIGDSGEVVLLEIDRAFAPSLSVGPVPARAVLVESAGITLAMDALTAKRADGITVDFVETPEGAAFKVDNPHEPPRVRQMSVVDLVARQRQGEPLRLIDVRTPGEWQTARIQGAELLDSDLMAQLEALPKDTMLVFQCHHGHRSQRVAEQFVPLGFSRVYNLAGGIDAYSAEIDASVPRY